MAVLGDVGELGDLTEQAHYNMGALAAMLGIDEIVAIAHQGGEDRRRRRTERRLRHPFCHQRRRLAATLTELLGPDTGYLVKASTATCTSAGLWSN